MATIAEILGRHWPNTEWVIDDDDYSTLRWFPGNTVPKPTEGEIRAFSASVDLELAAEARLSRQERAFEETIDAILAGFEIVINGMAETKRVLDDIRTKILPAALTGTLTTWDTDTVASVVNMRQRIQDLRNLP